MTELTPNYNIPYPSESDPWDITMAFQNMAVGIDDALVDIGGPGAAYRYVDTVYFTSSGTFTKASYPWLRAIRVKCVGGGGGSGGCAATGAGAVTNAASGGGAAYAESFITDIAGLAASTTVTVGAGGTGGAAGVNAGTGGGSSSFGSVVIAPGGAGGVGGGAFGVPVAGNGGAISSVGTGDFTVRGGAATASVIQNATIGQSFRPGAAGCIGGSLGDILTFSAIAAVAGNNYGEGGRAPANSQNQAAALAGASGAPGIVIVELYA